MDILAEPLQQCSGGALVLHQQRVGELTAEALRDRAQLFVTGKQHERAAIARAVIAKPELLLADEPTGNVDPALARRLLHLFVELNRLGTTVLLATHDAKLIAQAGAPVMHLEHGELRAA